MHVPKLSSRYSYFRVLLRVRMLYYLKQEVIGEHADSVLKGAHIRCVKLETLRQRAEQGL